MSVPLHRLKILRKLAGLTQNQLGAACDPECEGAWISKLETGKAELTVGWMRILAAALNCKPADLLSDEDVADRLAPPEKRLVEIYRLQSERDQARFLAMWEAFNQPSLASAALNLDDFGAKSDTAA